MAKINKSNVSGIIFLSAIVAITLFLVIFVFVTVGKPFVIKDFNDIKEATAENYKKVDKKHTEYYVIVYNFDEGRDNEVKDVVIAYANYARTTTDSLPIYAVDYRKNSDIANSSNLSLSTSDLSSKLPMLLYVKDGSVTKYSTISTVNQTLTTAMNK